MKGEDAKWALEENGKKVGGKVKTAKQVEISIEEVSSRKRGSSSRRNSNACTAYLSRFPSELP
jgi:hypothetical protein